MKIPPSTVKPRYYVAISQNEAFSSWTTAQEAIQKINEFEALTLKDLRYKNDYDKIIGVIKTEYGKEKVLVYSQPRKMNNQDQELVARFFSYLDKIKNQGDLLKIQFQTCQLTSEDRDALYTMPNQIGDLLEDLKKLSAWTDEL